MSAIQPETNIISLPTPTVILEEDGTDSSDITNVAGEATPTKRTTPIDYDKPSFLTYPCSPGEFKLQRQTFLVFTRILMAYLERHDPSLRQIAREVMRDCCKRSQSQEQGYESATDALHERLREILPAAYWNQVSQATRLFLVQRRCRCNSNMNNNDVMLNVIPMEDGPE